MLNPGFIQRAAEGTNKWYLYLVTIFLLFIANIVASLPVIVVMMFSDDPSAMQNMEALDPSALGVHPAIGLALLLLPFALSIPAIWFGVKVLHKRPFISLINPHDKIDWSRFFFSFGIWFALMVGFETVAWAINPDNYTFTFDAGTFFPTLLVVLLFIPLQTSMEELLFRGYFLQGLGLWFKRPWATILVTSIGFGLMHIANPEIEEFGPFILLYYIGFGVIMALMTVMDEGMELALGVHAANNIFGASFVTFSGSALQTPTLFTVEEYNVTLMSVIWLISSVIFVWIMSKRYSWTNWGKLWLRIDYLKKMDALIHDIGTEEPTEIADSEDNLP